MPIKLQSLLITIVDIILDYKFLVALGINYNLSPSIILTKNN